MISNVMNFSVVELQRSCRGVTEELQRSYRGCSSLWVPDAYPLPPLSFLNSTFWHFPPRRFKWGTNEVEQRYQRGEEEKLFHSISLIRQFIIPWVDLHDPNAPYNKFYISR
jgi:hypothetical protein